MTPVHQFIESYCAAVLAKDVQAFAALYDDDVEVFDMWSNWSQQGIEAWRGMAEQWFSSLEDETVVVAANEISCTEGADLCIGTAILTYTARSTSGETLRSLSNRLTVAMRRHGDGWQVIHEHTSAPIHHQTTKAILRYSRDV
ncbi:nuclear transport factor 2 family protein [Pseudoduganella sp. RAF19]|uniref:YybH family protein n=1 Tax=Pseudoduganella sp. RAF19 TaxID=3233052 RepID=UPI003F990BB5